MNEKLAIGKIVNTRGLKGELIVLSYNDQPESFLEYNNYYLFKEGAFSPLKLSSKKFLKGQRLSVKSPDISSIEEAQALKEFEIFIDKKEMNKDEDEFYYYECIDSSVFIGEKYIGTVTEIQNFGAGDLLQVLWEDKDKEIYLPILEEYLDSFDPQNKKIVYRDIDGLL